MSNTKTTHSFILVIGACLLALVIAAPLITGSRETPLQTGKAAYLLGARGAYANQQNAAQQADCAAGKTCPEKLASKP